MQNTFAIFLAETEDSPISLQLVKRLPFDSFCISFEDSSKLTGLFSESFQHADYLFVKVGIVDDQTIYVNIAAVEDYGNGRMTAGAVTTSLYDGDTFETAYHDDDFAIMSAEISSMSEAKNESRKLARLVLNAIQYICASNAEIKDVKTSKKNRPKIVVDGKERMVAVQTSEVGYAIGKRFEKWYADATDQERKSGGKRRAVSVRPHVRRAHWHHYWTGKGRTVYELRWIEPVFCCGDKEILPEVHEVSGENKKPASVGADTGK